MAHAISWDSELDAYQRGEFLRLLLFGSRDGTSARTVLQQFFVQRDDIHVARPGAARLFDNATEARGFIARQHPDLVELSAVASAADGVLGTWFWPQLEAR